MKVFSQLAWTILVSSVVLFAVTACGGGGGGGVDGAAFTGVQTQAVIDDSNAEQLVLDAYSGGSITDPLVIPLAAGRGSNQPLAPLARILPGSFPTLDFVPTVSPLAVQAIPGTCGGTATATVNEGSTSASGSIVYSNYCDAGVTLNGSVSFSATLNSSTNVVSMTMSFSSLTSNEGSLAGSMSMSFDLDDPVAPMTIGMNIVLTDAFTNRSYWVENYTIVITPGVATADSATVAGTYHDFDLGHISFTTTNPLLIDTVTGIPEAGTIHFVGANGTFADLTAIGGGNYTLNVSTGTVFNGTF